MAMHGLIGEGFEQFDLLVGERANLERRRIRIAPMRRPSRSKRVANDRVPVAE